MTLIISNTSLVLKGSEASHLTKTTQSTDEWVMIQDQNDIKVYLKEEVLPEGHFVSVKFENNSNTEVSFSWSLYHTKKLVQEYSSNLTVKAKGSEIFFDPTVMIQLKKNETLNEFSINLKYN